MTRNSRTQDPRVWQFEERKEPEVDSDAEDGDEFPLIEIHLKKWCATKIISELRIERKQRKKILISGNLVSGFSWCLCYLMTWKKLRSLFMY